MTTDDMLAAVLADPDDDLCRLVYADWLDDRGESHLAEFVRVQCELAAAEAQGSGRYAAVAPLLLRRQRELWHHAGVCRAFAAPADLTPVLAGSDLLPPAAAVVRRGFVAEVRLTLTQFAGDPCGACLGTRRRGGPRHWYECPYCSSTGRTGRTPDLAATLFARHPVTSVRLSGVRPWTDGGPAHRYGWTDSPDDFPAVPWHLPLALFVHLPPTDKPLPKNQYRRWYRTEARALDALSAACVAHGRSFAGLPLFHPPEDTR